MILLVLLLSLLSSDIIHALPAFPGAEGYGADTTHGRSGSICQVTRLDDDTSTGSLRYCLAVATGNRIVVFRVGGTIVLGSPLVMTSTNSNVYVAGQTAPGGGIQVKNWPIRLNTNISHVVFRHLRVRAGLDGEPTCDAEGACTDSMEVTDSSGNDYIHHIVFDHMTFMWATDENLSMKDRVRDSTVQWSIMAEGMREHSKGMLAGGVVSTEQVTLSVHHNLFAHNEDRNPNYSLISIGTGDPSPSGIVDVRNNLVYSWDQSVVTLTSDSPDDARAPRMNLINNHFLPNPDQTGSGPGNIVIFSGRAKIYLSGNIGTRCPSGCPSDEWDLLYTDGNANKEPNRTAYQILSEVSVPTVTTHDADELLTLITSNVGATKPTRDSTDSRVIDEVLNGEGTWGAGGVDGRSPTYPTLANGTPYTDTDGDGMSDTWETTCNGPLGTLNPNSATDGDDIISGIDASVNGYSQVEVFLNAMAGDYGANGLTTCAGLLDDTPPSTPSMNSPSVVSDSQINTSWSAATDAESGISGYELQYCTGSSCTPSTTITLGNVTSYNHTSLSPSTVYGYRVRAVNGAALEGSYSSPTVYATTNSATPDITTELVARWPLNGNTDDVVGSYDGTLQNFPADPSSNWVSGQINGGLDFDGTNDYLSLGDINEIDGVDELTISAWVKFDALQDYSTIFLKGTGNTVTAMQTGATGDGDGNNDPYLVVQDGSFSWGWTTGNLLTMGAWHHWAMVFDGSATGNANRLKFYFDGEPQTLTFSGTIPALTDANAISARLSDTGGPFNGVLDEVRLYSRALSSVDIDALFAMDDTIVILGAPSSLSTTETGTTAFLGNPSSLSTTETGTITVLGNPTSLSTTESGTTTFLGNPSSLGTP